jgi:hypothetical protein
MAGLLDIFGTSGAETMGLLGMSPEDVTRNRDEAQAQALFALAGRLFQGGKGGASIVEGLQQGQQAYKQAMQGSLQQQLQNAQIQEMLRKRQQEQLALAEQRRIQNVLGQGVTPEQVTYDGAPSQFPARDDEGNLMPNMAVKPAGFDIGRIAPQLMTTPEGRKALTDLISTQKAMGGEIFKLGEGEKQYQRNPLTGEVSEVATGGPRRRDTITVGNQVLDKNTMEVLYTAPEAPKVAKLTGKEGNAALMFFGTDDVSKLRDIPNAIDKIRVEATTQRKAEQPQINLNDPTAVQAQQLKTLNQWEGALKDSGAAETAMRAQGFYAAYEQALKGNANADGALIYNVAKVYDPAGAVQAGDVSTVIGVPSMPETIKKAAQKLTTGGSLTPKERDNMKKIIDAVVDERSRMIAPSLNTYRKINRGLGGTDDLIVNPYDMVKKPKTLENILGLDRPRGGQ